MASTNLSAAALYGKGIFTTVAIHDGKPFLWEKHWRRLGANAATLNIDLSEHPESATRQALVEALFDGDLKDGRARITLTDESPSTIWSKPGGKKTSLSIVVAKHRPIPGSLKLTTSPHRVNTTSPLVGLKSCNYLEHLLAYEEATKRGFHEAVRLNERGEITSACMANVFWEKDGNLFTPSLKTGCLPGTTREFVLENVKCEEVEADVEGLGSADRIFLTSAGVEIATVAAFDGRELDRSAHRLSALISGSG